MIVFRKLALAAAISASSALLAPQDVKAFEFNRRVGHKRGTMLQGIRPQRTREQRELH